jgi:hypothetical protein
MRYLYVKYQIPIHNDSKDIAQVSFSKLGQSSRSRSAICEISEPVPYDSKDTSQVKVFQI